MDFLGGETADNTATMSKPENTLSEWEKLDMSVR
jgi:hypothetical protein